MCFAPKIPDPVTPAAAPAAPLPTPDAPKIGETREEENLKNFGSDAPRYRVRTDADYGVDRSNRPNVAPSGGPIKM